MSEWEERCRLKSQPWEFLWLDRDQGPMKSGDKVRVVRWVGDGMTALVEHPEHGQHMVGSGGLDLPCEFKTASGRWIPESDPRVEVFLLKALDDVRTGGAKIIASEKPELRRLKEREILRLLERNGWGAC